MAQVEQLRESREFIRHQTSEFPQILEGETNSWWKSTARLLINFRNRLESYPDAGLRDYFIPQIEGFMEQLRSAASLTPSGKDDFASLADHMIMNFSMEIARPFEKQEFQIEKHFLPLNDMVQNQPDRFKTDTRTIKGEECVVLSVKHPTENYWQEIPLPSTKKV